MRRALRAATAVCLGLCVSCASLRPGASDADAPRPDLQLGVELVESGSVHGFYERTLGFYGRLALRRFNTLDTYRDAQLRGFFRTAAAFSDYYADLADDLFAADFEKNRPLVLEVLDFAFDAPGLARVRVRMIGEDARPLRPGEVGLERLDRWERVDGVWWIVPGKL